MGTGYASPTWFGGLGHKTTDKWFCRVWASKPGMVFEAARCIIRVFVLRRSYLVKGSWPSNARISTYTILPLGLSGSAKISKDKFGLFNSSINQRRGCPNQPISFSAFISVSRFSSPVSKSRMLTSMCVILSSVAKDLTLFKLILWNKAIISLNLSPKIFRFESICFFLFSSPPLLCFH